MRIILDTDKKTITVPWNYTDKLAAMNHIIREATGAEDKTLTQLKTAQKPVKAEKKG